MNKKFWAVAMMISLAACAPGKKESHWPLGVNYEVFVRSFADGNGDGLGDFKGLTAKLDYLQDLGVSGLWLMPIMPSDTYHKYHVIDYKAIDPDYGTMEDFRIFVKEAHKRNIRIITDFVINHTGNKHPWFLEASKGKDNPYRDYYVWAAADSIKGSLYKQHASEDSYNLRKWHPVEGDTLGEQYYGYFNGLCPDLNLDNQKVRDEILDISRFWLNDVGVDGFRLDAARHIFPEDRNPDNYAFWEWFRAEMLKIKPDVYLVGEVWQPAEEVAPYLKGLPSLFNFDLGYAIINDVRAGWDSVKLVEGYKKTRDVYTSVTNEYLDATFVRNHDQPRTMTELKDDQPRARMAAALLLTMPGTPYLYYGEEIGMRGAKSMNYKTILGPDIYIREPFLWAEGKSVPLQTSWMKAEFSTPETVKPLSVQSNDPNSLYQFYRKLIAYRNGSDVLTKGELVATDLNIREVVTFLRTYKEQELLVAHNLSDVEVTIPLSGNWNRFTAIDYDTSGSATITAQGLVIPAFSSVVIR